LAHYQAGNLVYVACGKRGLLVLREDQGALKLVELRPLSGSVDGFFVAAGKVWASVTEERAVALSDLEFSTSAGPPHKPAPGLITEVNKPSAPILERSVEGRVIEVTDRNVFVDIGSLHQLELADRLALSESNSLLSSSESSAEPRVVVAQVVELWPEKARLRVGVNEQVKVGAYARLTTEEVTRSRIAPPRVTGPWELRAMARPLFSLGAVGAGILAELSVGQRAAFWHYGVHLSPIGFGVGDEGATLPWAGHVFAAFDTKVFAVGLGVGAQSVNDTDIEIGSGLGVVQRLRIGALDGLHLMGRSSVVIFRSETEFATLELQGQFGVGDGSWMIFRGGGGSVGYGFGEVAVRNLISGNGADDSFFLEVALGGAFVRESGCLTTAPLGSFDICPERHIGGPMIGLGGEWRL
jgi:hypothetical protein